MRLLTAAALTLTAAVVLTPAVRAQDTGVAVCDQFLKSYQTCIDTKAPDAAKAQMRSALDAVRSNWKAVAATPEGKKSLEPACKQTIDQIKQQASGLGCQW
jgi:phosphohistidine phosphatase SixA